MIPASNSLLLASADEGYNLTRSLRFRASASAYLSRTNTSTVTNNKIFTYSLWVKRGLLTTTIALLSGDNSSAQHYFGFGNSTAAADNLEFYDGQTAAWKISTNNLYRDPSAGYHIILAVDTTQATAANRVHIYVNGIECSYAVATYPAQNTVPNINVASMPLFIGKRSNAASWYLDGYLTEVNFIDGQALTPSSFGSTNSTTGVWQPAKYTGTYGTNGFYLPFTDNSALTTSSNVGLGKDFSGNGNYWVTNNISLTAGVTYDSMTDVPTLTNATTANYAVLNPLAATSGTSITNGNLTITGGNQGTVATIIPTSGKWYWEVTLLEAYVAAANYFGGFGVTNGLVATYDPTLYGAGVRAYNTGGAGGGGTYVNNTQITSSGTWAVNDVIGFAFDVTNLTLDCYRNNVKIGTTLTVPAGYIYPTFYQNGTADTSSSAANFGQRPFSFSPPSGFVALNTYNLPDSTIKQGNKVMDATLYTGNGSTQTITNAASFKPDLVWVKSRSAATDHKLTDSVRGVTKGLISNSTGAETTDANGLTAFNSNGWSLGADTAYNTNGSTYVGWQWQAGQGSSSSNTSGTITSTVSVNASAGFSVVTYTGTGANATVGHGLGVAPSLMIVKNRSTGADWYVYHASIGATNTLYLSATNASTSAPSVWNSTAPTSSVFSIGTNYVVNGSTNTFVAYCWAEITGYSKFGSYVGNSSADGVFVYLGFQPAYVMVKITTATGLWVIKDYVRAANYNPQSGNLYANLANAEDTGSADYIDFVSNGFKIRGTAADINTSGNTYVFAAFAQNPFKNSLAR